MDFLHRYSLEEAMVYLACRNFTYKDISHSLVKSHEILLSPNAIGKRLKKIGFPSRRCNPHHGENEVRQAIEAILPDLPETVGYRSMTSILQRKGMHVRRDTVVKTMRIVDRIGVKIRRRRRILRRVYRAIGPNYVWHVDGYDKLKPFGFAIHGCIDGFSRRIMWLVVGPSNNDPAIVAKNYVKCVKTVGGCPLVLQSDPGTENTTLGSIQCVFRHDSEDCFSGIDSYHVVRSVFNQRIEAWWSSLRRRQSQWWIDYFKDLQSFELFHQGNAIEICCLRYSFMHFLQEELDCVSDEWNTHYISLSRQAACPNGRPDVLYSLGHGLEKSDCLQPVSEGDVEWAMSMCKTSTISGSEEFDSLAQSVLALHHRRNADNWREAMDNYILLINTCS